MSKILEVKNLKKSYGAVKAVDDISFFMEEGQLFAFLGPNGAGKSTTIDIICTLLKPDQGEVLVNGHRLGQNDDAIRSSIGVVFQDGFLDSFLTVAENIKTRGRFYGLTKEELESAFRRVVEATGVGDFVNRHYRHLSGGQRRRSDIARALIHTPKILFLDEPTTGLDPQTRLKVWETIITMQKETGMSVFLTTHYMEEAAEADYVVIIDKGKIAAKGTPLDLKKEYAHDTLRLVFEDLDKLKEALDALKVSYEVLHQEILVKLDTTMDALAILDVSKPYIKGFEVLNGTLDDAFITVTGREMRG
ncbi:MAG: ABC transporter ATP-binding protein [Bacilli bacterium]|jgi:multidrug/hemolysin transport system ATP-binding protein